MGNDLRRPRGVRRQVRPAPAPLSRVQHRRRELPDANPPGSCREADEGVKPNPDAWSLASPHPPVSSLGISMIESVGLSVIGDSGAPCAHRRAKTRTAASCSRSAWTPSCRSARRSGLPIPVGRLHNDRHIPLHPQSNELLDNWVTNHSSAGAPFGPPLDRAEPATHRTTKRLRRPAQPPR